MFLSQRSCGIRMSIIHVRRYDLCDIESCNDDPHLLAIKQDTVERDILMNGEVFVEIFNTRDELHEY